VCDLETLRIRRLKLVRVVKTVEKEEENMDKLSEVLGLQLIIVSWKTIYN
jgi:hypothetical protein